MAKKIYLADDEQDIREILTEFLSNAGYEVTAYKNGDTLFSAFQEKPCDLVILDIMMPGISGIKTCEEIRKISHVPVLFLTAKSQESDKLLGLMAGGDDYLVKPFSYAELLARVKALLRRYHVYSQSSYFLISKDALCPPKPRELVSAYLISIFTLPFPT